MITFSNGRLYKLVYIDTNIINEISKNTNKLGKNFFLKYVNGEYMFVTSAFNVYELSKSKGESKNKIIQIFNNIPLGITCTFPQLIEFEKMHTGFHKDMVMFATGPKGIFNNQLENIFYIMQNDKSFDDKLAYYISTEELYDIVLFLLKTIRSLIINLICCINIEERKKCEEANKEHKFIPPLNTYPIDEGLKF